MPHIGSGHARHHEGHSIPTNFRRKSWEFLKEMKRSKRPVVLTVNGNAEAVVQDVESYQRLLDSAARADVY